MEGSPTKLANEERSIRRAVRQKTVSRSTTNAVPEHPPLSSRPRRLGVKIVLASTIVYVAYGRPRADGDQRRGHPGTCRREGVILCAPLERDKVFDCGCARRWLG